MNIDSESDAGSCEFAVNEELSSEYRSRFYSDRIGCFSDCYLERVALFITPGNTFLFSAPFAPTPADLDRVVGSHRRGFDHGRLGDCLPGLYLPRYRSSRDPVTAPAH
jgi:hypothetical protein